MTNKNMSFNLVLKRIQEQLENRQLVEQAMIQARADFTARTSMKVGAVVWQESKLKRLWSWAKPYLIKYLKFGLIYLWKLIQAVWAKIEAVIISAITTWVMSYLGWLK